MLTHKLPLHFALISTIYLLLVVSCQKKDDQESLYSPRLEESKGFMKIRLGSHISNYHGFKEMPITQSDVPPGIKIWGYTAKDNKYSKLGEFEVRSYAYEKAVTEDMDRIIPLDQQAKWPELFLFVYTLNDTVSAIKVDISNRKNGQNTIFNHYLADVYGPTMGSESNPNDIEQNIQTGNTVQWQSENVSLESKILTVNRYFQGRQLDFDVYSQLTYKWKPAFEKLNKLKDTDQAQKIGELKEQL